jgi:putative PEP-CTERM system integral membrane protein
LSVMFKVFFIAFNAIVLLLVYVGFLPWLVWQFSASPDIGWLPWDFLMPMIGLVAVPTSIAVTTIKRPRTPLPSLARVFYGIEMPLLFILSLRFFVLRELTGATAFLLITAILGIAAFAFRNFWRDRPTPTWAAVLQTVGHGFFLATALYLLGLYIFIAIPLNWSMLMNLATVIFGAAFLSPLTVLFFGYYSLPIGLAYLAIHDYRPMLKAFSSKVGRPTAYGVGVLVPLAWLGSFVILQHQPQTGVLSLLEKPAQTISARQTLLDRTDQVRAGLVNAYLSKYRYLGIATKDSKLNYNGIGTYYRDTFHVTDQDGLVVQRAFDFWAAPFLYQGEASDSQNAAQHYANFFDQPILRAESSAVAAALNSTWDRTSMKAGLMDINQEKVLLTRQDLDITPHGDWADVSIHEIYQNRTTAQQEVLYYFSLPETATITGLWLGESDRLDQRFEFQVSPRGAAQQVYSNQLERRIDPALLEQVGPGNYRLRAFPVPPQKDKPMHLWLTYKAFQRADGGWPLPQLNERRNIFWNGSTQRQYNGKSQPGDQAAWFPNQMAGGTQRPQTHTANFGGDQLVAEPFTPPASTFPTGESYAVVLDTSFSMGTHRAEVEKALTWLTTQIAPDNGVDLYLTRAEGVAPARIADIRTFKPAEAQFFGTLSPKQLLNQFMQLRRQIPSESDRAYNGIIVLTDKGSYELNDNSRFQATLPAPLWMVHLGGLAAAYDDDTQQAIKNSRGGVVTDASEAIRQLWFRRQLGDSVVTIADGYTWKRSPNAAALPATETSLALVSNQPNFMPIAARQWVMARSQEIQPTQTSELDAIHTIAKTHKIVTPYSSMIVLVNDRQRQELEEAENRSDRFDREVEDQQQLPKPGGVPEVSGVPEPQEWLLLLVMLGLLYGGVRFSALRKTDLERHPSP